MSDETAETIKALRSMVCDPDISVEHSPTLIVAARLLSKRCNNERNTTLDDVIGRLKASGMHWLVGDIAALKIAEDK